MALTKIGTDGIKDDAVTTDKVANAINTSIAANTAKDLTALSAANLTSGTIPDARFPATLPAASAANLTAVPAANITGTLPAISATNLTNIPAANLTGTLPAISGANLTGISSAGKAHNLVINGAMNIAQRNTSSTGTGYDSMDRYKQYHGGVDESPTYSQADVASGTSPYSAGFRKCFRITNGNQTSVGSNDHIYFRHIIESQNVATSGWDYKNSSSNVTLSFWIKSSVAQQFKGYLRSTSTSGANSSQQMFPFAIGALSANTWTKFTITIPGHANLEFDYDTGSGLDINIAGFFGTGYSSSGTTENAWANYSSSGRVKDMTDTWYTTNDATLEVTGLQLEVGDSATDFEHLSYGDELIKCMRYYQVIIMSGHPSGGGTTGGLGGTPYSNGSSVYCPYRFPVEMRAEPTLESSAGTGSGSGTFRTRRGNNYNFNSFQGTNTINPTSGTLITNGNAGGGDVGDYIWIETNAGAKLALDAEV